MSNTDALELFAFADAKSTLPSPLKSELITEMGPFTEAKFTAGAKLPVPLPINIDISLLLLLNDCGHK